MNGDNYGSWEKWYLWLSGKQSTRVPNRTHCVWRARWAEGNTRQSRWERTWVKTMMPLISAVNDLSTSAFQALSFCFSFSHPSTFLLCPLCLPFFPSLLLLPFFPLFSFPHCPSPPPLRDNTHFLCPFAPLSCYLLSCCLSLTLHFFPLGCPPATTKRVRSHRGHGRVWNSQELFARLLAAWAACWTGKGVSGSESDRERTKKRWTRSGRKIASRSWQHKDFGWVVWVVAKDKNGGGCVLTAMMMVPYGSPHLYPLFIQRPPSMKRPISDPSQTEKVFALSIRGFAWQMTVVLVCNMRRCCP